jgi:hypothetical protein
MKYELKERPISAILNDLSLENRGLVQKYLDKRVAENLQPYVSFKTGAQEQSILSSLDAGSGYVHILVPYAEYQAYSKRIHKRNGKRGTRPFERMVADKKHSIEMELADYAKKVGK